MFSQRIIRPEMLDHVSPEEARPNLADLVRINRHFGGHSVLRKTLGRVAATSDAASFLDVGAASGDSAQVIRELYPRSTITSLDCNPTNLEVAPHPKLLADAFELPFAPASFDYVICSLFLHHFENGQVVDLLRSLHSVSSKALIVCDLERHILPYLFLAATKPLFGWNRITVHDGLRSVRASFRAKELHGLARTAGIQNRDVRVHRPAFRLAMVAIK